MKAFYWAVPGDSQPSTIMISMTLGDGIIYSMDGRLTTRSRETSKPGDSGLDFSNRSEIRQAPRQQLCQDAIKLLERFDDYNIYLATNIYLRDFIRFCGWTSARLVRRSPDIRDR